MLGYVVVPNRGQARAVLVGTVPSVLAGGKELIAHGVSLPDGCDVERDGWFVSPRSPNSTVWPSPTQPGSPVHGGGLPGVRVRAFCDGCGPCSVEGCRAEMPDCDVASEFRVRLPQDRPVLIGVAGDHTPQAVREASRAYAPTVLRSRGV